MTASPDNPKPPALDAKGLAIQLARASAERNAEEICILDLRETSPITDYFVIATGSSDRMIRTLCDEAGQLARDHGHKVVRRAGYDTGDWIIMDLVDVVAHWFTPSKRSYCDLELIWGEAQRVDWQKNA